MKVTVKRNELVTTPVYEPAPGRLEELIKFYKEQFHTYQIDGYKIENSFGVVVAEEGNL
jgi:uncharacterized protein YcnI